jgi:filamentous hemagglutinin family protein
MRDSAHFRAAVAGLFLIPALASGGVVTDGTVGAAGAIAKVGSDFPIPHTLGTKVGGNLFHSFSQFDLAAGESGTFTGPGDVGNILARVTGGSASTIDGTLRSTIPGANLFFINPKGVIFGANAKLEIDGSFTATTADYLKLAGGGRFDAKTPASDVLTAAPVSAFGFLGPQSAAISATNSTLTGASGKKLSFVGGDLSLNRATLTAPSGRIDLWSAKAPGEVAASDGTGALGGAINLLRTRVDTSGTPAGSVVIRGGRLAMDRSAVVSDNAGAGAGGAVDVRVADAVRLDLASRIFTSTRGSGSAGDVAVRAGSVQVVTDSVIGSQATATTTGTARSGDVRVAADVVGVGSGSSISASTFGLGNGGLVEVQARTLSLAGNPAEQATAGIFSNTNATGAGGAGGGVHIRADTLRLTGGGAISADTFGLGKGGDIDVAAKDIFIAARGSSFKTGIFADSGGVPDLISPGGAGGSIRIAADRLQITDGGLVSTKSVGLGSGGDTVIDVGELVIAKGNSGLITGIAVDAAAGSGAGGDLRITADEIRVTGGGRISANAGDTGPGGDISIRAHSIFITGTPDDPSTISAESTSLGNGGPAGKVEVITDRLQILDGARISAATAGGGAGGDVFVRANTAFFSAGTTGAFTGIAALSTSTTLPGAGGNVRAEFGNLVITSSGGIAANTLGPGAGGDVSVTADAVRLLGGGRISADTSGLGAGGSVVVRTGDLSISGRAATQSSGIFSGSSATGDGGAGGRVQVQANTLRLFDRGSIAATSASSGEGGSVTVKARQLTLDSGATIEASATGDGMAGSVAITVQQPLKLRGGSAVRTTSAISDAGTVAITSATDIHLTDSTVAVSALVGNAGQVSLLAAGTIYLLNSSVVAEAGLNGGNVFIDPEFVLLDHSRISANAILGAGGNILIITDTFLASSSAVTASSEASVQGSVQIESLNVDLSGALVLLPTSLVDVSTQLREQCARRLGMDFSSFLVLGRGGTEQTPEDPLPASAPRR